MHIQYTEHGNPDDLYFITEKMRRCPTCDTPKAIEAFKDKPRSTIGEVSIDCRACLDSRRSTELAARQTNGEDLLVNALATATRRRALLDAAPRAADGVRMVIQFLGGEEKTYRMVSRALKNGLRSANPEIARKAAATLIDFIVRAEKQAGEPIDLSELTDEDRQMILMEPAKQLLLKDAGLRRQLLNDLDVRKALLGDEGREVLEVSSER